MFIICVGCAASYKFYKIILRHNKTIYELQKNVKELNAKISLFDIKQSSNTNEVTLFIKDCRQSNFNYLAIGNSITKHSVCDIWWNKCGMAASAENKDYFHLVVDRLKTKYKSVNALAINNFGWETLSHDRVQPLSIIEKYLNDDLNLVTIQIGENVMKEVDGSYGTYEVDFMTMINCIKKKATKAKILIVGDFWGANKERDNIKKVVSEKCNVKYVSLEEISDKSVYQSKIGARVFDKDGKEFIINHTGVALHPNDQGMLKIAELILQNL